MWVCHLPKCTVVLFLGLILRGGGGGTLEDSGPLDALQQLCCVLNGGAGGRSLKTANWASPSPSSFDPLIYSLLLSRSALSLTYCWVNSWYLSGQCSALIMLRELKRAQSLCVWFGRPLIIILGFTFPTSPSISYLSVVPVQQVLTYKISSGTKLCTRDPSDTQKYKK